MTPGVFEKQAAEGGIGLAALKEDTEFSGIPKGKESGVVVSQQACGGIITGGDDWGFRRCRFVENTTTSLMGRGEGEKVTGGNELIGVLFCEGSQPVVAGVFPLLTLDFRSELILQDGASVKNLKT